MTQSILINEIVIARIDRAGVFMGKLDHIDSDIVRLKDVRRIYTWNGALSVTDMAQKGIADGKVTAPCEVVEFNRSNLVELNKCSESAENKIKAVTPWEA